MTDVPMPRRKCDGLAWGRPCPAYDDGTFPEGCDCYMRLNDREGDNSLVWTLFTLALAAIAIVAMTVVVLGAECLTQKQARAKWPSDYLYWHTADRCWDNKQPYPKVNRRLKGDRLKPAPLLDANGNEIQSRRMPHLEKRSARPRDVKVVRWTEFNELDAAADRETYFGIDPLTVWRLWDERIGM